MGRKRWYFSRTLLLVFLAFATVSAESKGNRSSKAGSELPSPILFVTQFPIAADFATIGSVFANHRGDVQSAGRGGDLWILYPDGERRNLTAEAGFGTVEFQGTTSIAVRGPAVHWDGQKALFSMVVGAVEERYEQQVFYWQMYEVSGFGKGETVAIDRVLNQPENYNNVSAIYGSDDRILFVSDRPRGGERHLYPQRDEYESTATPTGLWSLDPETGDLFLMQHSPSGSFTPIVDSFGRVVFTRWDHLQQDQQADTDVLEGDTYGTFDYLSEAENAVKIDRRVEVFPEPRTGRDDLLAGTPFNGHRLNSFFPWQILQDGTEEEFLNHLGRHELQFYFNRARSDDPNLEEFIDAVSGRTNPRSIENMLQMREDPTSPGRYVATDAPEFQSHASGQLIALAAAPDANPDSLVVEHLTHPETQDVIGDNEPAPAGHSGHYRDPLPLSNGLLVAAFTSERRAANNDGTRNAPQPRYGFQLHWIVAGEDNYQRAGEQLTEPITKTVSYWDPDELVEWTGELWQLDPVEVRSRPRPPMTTWTLSGPEQTVFDELGASVEAFRAYLRQNNLALMVSRNLTARDQADKQQPFNLSVPGGVETRGAPGTMYEIEHLQLFQADQVRGYGGIDSPQSGRRVLARPMHDDAAVAANLDSDGPPASVRIADDGSIAAVVPARRAMAWQSTDGAGDPIVRERFWISFQPGEIRTCDGCHGVNSTNQAGEPAYDQPPQALRQFLQAWLADRETCVEDGTSLCLQDGRFRVRAEWKTNADGGQGQAVRLTPDTGYFWFFDQANVEVVGKLLDACSLGAEGRFWFFAAGLTNVEVTLTVTDLTAGETKTYTSGGGAFQPIQDTEAFSTCF